MKWNSSPPSQYLIKQNNKSMVRIRVRWQILLQIKSIQVAKVWFLSDTYSSTRKHTSFHSQISCSLIMFGWSYRHEKLDLSGSWRAKATYEHFEDVDFVDEGRIIFDLFLLDCFNRKLLVALSVFGQIDDSKTAIGQLGLEWVYLFDVSLCWVHEILWLVCGCIAAACSALTVSIWNHDAFCNKAFVLKSFQFD